MFSANGYPISFFNNVYDKFMLRNDGIKLEKPKPPYRIIFKLPFVGKPSIDFQKEISKLVLDKFKVVITAVYVATKVGDLFSLKSKVPLSLSSDVVYKYTCSLDPSTSYIGKTERHLIVRAREHLDVRGEGSAVGDHVASCEDCQTAVRSDPLCNFTVLRRCNKYDVEFYEALLIKRFQPILNRQLFRSGSNKVLKIFG